MNVLLMLALLGASDVSVVRRFALIVGSNDGGRERVRLRYANTDAVAISRVMSELGGVRDDDAMLLRDANATTLRGAVARMKQHIAALRVGDERLEFVLYYSGHSNEEGLLLAGEKLSYTELRAMVADMPVDVKIAILDSCASGALVRLKGGQRRQAFLVDASAKARGHAFITSSSADEASQESDRIAGSFFTHYLVSGLRGAADTTGDKRVTLNEAYQFAFSETLARTEKTQSGAQHPNYDIQLAGSGDLVMTDVRSTRAGIVFDEPVDGRLFVRDASDRLVVELNKTKDKPAEIGLAAGVYTITRESGATIFVAKVAVNEGQRVALDSRAFVAIERERTARRGDEPKVVVEAPAPTPEPEPESAPVVVEPEPKPRAKVKPADPTLEDEPKRVPVMLALGGSVHTGRGRARIPSSSFVLGLGHTQTYRLNGLALAFGANDVRFKARGLVLSLGANHHQALDGLSFTLGAAVTATDMNGIVGAVGATTVGQNARGIQLAVGANVTKERMSGMQVAVGANITGDWHKGLQLAVAFNHADALSGAQLALVNSTKGMRGIQIGLINVATNLESGLQLGLINITKSGKGAQLGLFSLTADEPVRMQFFASDMHTFNVGLRYGSRYLYGIALAGFQPFDGREVRGAYGLGIGVHVPFWHLFLNIDTSIQHLLVQPTVFRSPHFLLQQRLALAGQILPRLAIMVGVSWNSSFVADSTELPLEQRDVSWLNAWTFNGWRLWPGFFAGLQI